jgi:hypothetical protein
MNISLLDRLGIPGVISLGLMLFCLSFYLGNLGPAQEALKDLKQEAAQLLAAAGGQAEEISETAATKHSVSLQPLPFLNAFPQILHDLNALAEQHRLIMEDASYTLTEDAGQRRMEINLPFKTGYLPLRAYLRAILLLKIAPSLDELTLKRQRSTDPLIEANLRLFYYFAPAP